ncbi:MAG: type II toxin-antitoxin system Phd/YefM family antitoxin [Calditrichaeota bacterium]|nr:type II toxin-antitoxin system Phd/YefM family antitoxin [Calditrichota bacterium]
MKEISFNKFSSNIKLFVDEASREKENIRVIRRSGKDFIVTGIEEWERLQETIYVLQNAELLRQIIESSETNHTNTGYIPQKEEIDEITRI